MKKRVFAFIVVMIIFINPVLTRAEIVGSVITTDIKAYIDHLLVPTYNIDGYTCVVVRDLEDYGYTVLWDEESRTVNFFRDFSKPAQPQVPSFDPLPLGTKLFDVQSTDIVVFFRGVQIPAFNIAGRTAVRLRDINMVGEVKFDSVNKIAEVFCNDVEFFDDEIDYIRNHFYDMLLTLAELDYNHQKLVPLIDEKIYDNEKETDFKNFYNSIKGKFDDYKEYKEPYGFNSSSMELWWAIVNMRYATETLLQMYESTRNGMDISASYSEYKQYRIDSLEQRRVALIKLTEDLMNLTYVWD